jgi:hypothetical protein
MNSLQLFAGGLLGLLVFRLLLNWNKQRHAPGPLLAGFTDYWAAYHQFRGQLRDKLIELHKEHGPVVRYGVNRISIRDPSAIGIIYGSRAGFETVSLLPNIMG